MYKISVLLPVKNGEKYISESIDSILQQSYSDFELLIIDDDSTDRTLEIVNSYSDSRIKVFKGTEGFISNLNLGIEVSDCSFLARMDADDIMYPERLENQIRIMENYKVDICSSWMTVFGEGFDAFLLDNLEGIIVDPLKWLLYKNFISHPTTMIRKGFLLDKALRYDHGYPCAEDYKLWFEIAKKNGVFYVDRVPCLKYRISTDQVTSIRKQEMKRQSAKIQNEIFEYLLAYG